MLRSYQIDLLREREKNTRRYYFRWSLMELVFNSLRFCSLFFSFIMSIPLGGDIIINGNSLSDGVPYKVCHGFCFKYD